MPKKHDHPLCMVDEPLDNLPHCHEPQDLPEELCHHRYAVALADPD